MKVFTTILLSTIALIGVAPSYGGVVRRASDGPPYEPTTAEDCDPTDPGEVIQKAAAAGAYAKGISYIINQTTKEGFYAVGWVQQALGAVEGGPLYILITESDRNNDGLIDKGELISGILAYFKDICADEMIEIYNTIREKVSFDVINIISGDNLGTTPNRHQWA